jgi:hypothetical protein
VDDRLVRGDGEDLLAPLAVDDPFEGAPFRSSWPTFGMRRRFTRPVGRAVVIRFVLSAVTHHVSGTVDAVFQSRVGLLQHQETELLLLLLAQEPLLAWGRPRDQMPERGTAQAHLADPAVAHVEKFGDLHARRPLVQQSNGALTQVQRVRMEHERRD